ncbi:MAG: ABC transporter permease [Gemmatimonadota bacterium]|nr:ABC transporter permease [Gemmatimonadota bacterium]
MIGFYRALLRLYPSGFRAEYHEEPCAVFAERISGYSGPLPRVALGIVALADVVPNAVAAHWDILRQDLRYAVRAVGRTPGFALTAVLLVALGVGANTAAFSLADFVFLRPLPYPEANRLVKLWQSSAGLRADRAVARQLSRLESAGAVGRVDGCLHPPRDEPRGHGGAAPARDRGDDTGAMGMLGVPALAGRVFSQADSTGERVVVLSHALWQTQFGGDPGTLNAVVRLDGAPFIVIGVMPPTFHFPDREAEAWTPLFLREADFLDRNDNYLEVIARLRDGGNLEEAEADFAGITAVLEQEFPKENKETRALVLGLRDELSTRARLLVFALCGGALCILLLACANLASLFLARAMHRARELAVRAALGAGRERLVRQLASESLGLAVMGGIVGVAVALAGVPLLARLVPATFPTAAEPTVDLRVLIAAVVLVVLTGLGFGVGPAVGARWDLAGGLAGRGGDRHQRREQL